MNEQEKTARNEARIAAARRDLRQALVKAVKGERGAGHDTASGSRRAAAEGRGTSSGQDTEAGQ